MQVVISLHQEDSEVQLLQPLSSTFTTFKMLVLSSAETAERSSKLELLLNRETTSGVEEQSRYIIHHHHGAELLFCP